MPKKLLLKNMSATDGLTVKELKSYLNQFTDENVPVVLKCGKNFRLGKMLTSNATHGPVLVGKRSALK
jgi:hypothetical protein